MPGAAANHIGDGPALVISPDDDFVVTFLKENRAGID
jgi:hypothetical protein